MSKNNGNTDDGFLPSTNTDNSWFGALWPPVVSIAYFSVFAYLCGLIGEKLASNHPSLEVSSEPTKNLVVQPSVAAASVPGEVNEIKTFDKISFPAKILHAGEETTVEGIHTLREYIKGSEKDLAGDLNKSTAP